MARRGPRAPKHVVSLWKVCEGRLSLQKERSKLVDRGKWLKETRLGVGLVSNSCFRNAGDARLYGFMGQWATAAAGVGGRCMWTMVMSDRRARSMRHESARHAG
jgi:hypothetical protein